MFIPATYTGDSGYGCEENYEDLEELGTESYLKYNNFHYEETSACKDNIFHKDNMIYDSENDCFICPSGKKIQFREEKEIKTGTGYLTQIRQYECENCDGCPLRPKCTKSTTNVLLTFISISSHKSEHLEDSLTIQSMFF